MLEAFTESCELVLDPFAGVGTTRARRSTASTRPGSRALTAQLVKGPDVEPPRPREPKTVNNVLTVLAKILRCGEGLGHLRAVPRIHMLKVNRPSVEFLDFDEGAALLEAAKKEPEWILAVLLAGDAGLRCGELRALRWGDWERRAGCIMVQRSVWKAEGGTKGWRARALPTTTRLAAALQAERHLRGDLVLCDSDGEPIVESAWRTVLPRLCLRAGIKEIGWHTLRHTFCSHLVRGAPAKASRSSPATPTSPRRCATCTSRRTPKTRRSGARSSRQVVAREASHPPDHRFDIVGGHLVEMTMSSSIPQVRLGRDPLHDPRVVDLRLVERLVEGIDRRRHCVRHLMFVGDLAERILEHGTSNSRRRHPMALGE
jgi:hypothetical protein